MNICEGSIFAPDDGYAEFAQAADCLASLAARAGKRARISVTS